MSAAGDIPADWPILRAKFIFRERQDRSSTGEEELLSVSHISGITNRSDKEVNMFLAETTEGYKIVCKGDAVVNTMWAWMGAMGVSDVNGIISPSYGVYRPISEKLDGHYYDYLFRSLPFVADVNRRSKGIWSSRLRLYPDEFLNLRLPFPNFTTQRQIADFLDRETARIDQLIEKKQRLVELLLEREKNLIGECLARGLDRNSQLKQTDLEWLGEIPEHWQVCPLKTLIWYQEGPGILAEDFRDGGVPLLRIKGLSGSHATLQGCNYLNPEKVERRWKHFRVEIGDYLISASATRGGIASLVTEETEGAVPYTGIIRIKPRTKGFISDIIPYFLLSSLFEAQIDLLSAGSTIQHFGPSHLGRMKAPLPPRQEQIQIAIYLDERVPVIQDTRRNTDHSQDRLREFRSTLITAAVTGQIDVTTWRKRGETGRHLDQIEEAQEKQKAHA